PRAFYGQAPKAQLGIYFAIRDKEFSSSGSSTVLLRIFHASLFLRSKMSYLDGTANATLCDAVPRCFLSMSLVTASSRSISRDSRYSSFKYWVVTLARAFCHERNWIGKSVSVVTLVVF